MQVQMLRIRGTSIMLTVPALLLVEERKTCVHVA